MKKIMISLSLMVVVLMAEAQTREEEALIKQLDQHNAATLINNDTVALKKYLANDFLLNSSSNKVSFGAERIVSAIRSGRLKYVQFDVVTDTVYFLDKKTAISMGSETAVYGSEGPLKGQVQNRRFTNFWIREKTAWMLKARHSSLICAN